MKNSFSSDRYDESNEGTDEPGSTQGSPIMNMRVRMKPGLEVRVDENFLPPSAWGGDGNTPGTAKSGKSDGGFGGRPRSKSPGAKTKTKAQPPRRLPSVQARIRRNRSMPQGGLNVAQALDKYLNPPPLPNFEPEPVKQEEETGRRKRSRKPKLNQGGIAAAVFIRSPTRTTRTAPSAFKGGTGSDPLLRERSGNNIRQDVSRGGVSQDSRADIRQESRGGVSQDSRGDLRGGDGGLPPRGPGGGDRAHTVLGFAHTAPEPLGNGTVTTAAGDIPVVPWSIDGRPRTALRPESHVSILPELNHAKVKGVRVSVDIREEKSRKKAQFMKGTAARMGLLEHRSGSSGDMRRAQTAQPLLSHEMRERAASKLLRNMPVPEPASASFPFHKPASAGGSFFSGAGGGGGGGSRPSSRGDGGGERPMSSSASARMMSARSGRSGSARSQRAGSGRNGSRPSSRASRRSGVSEISIPSTALSPLERTPTTTAHPTPAHSRPSSRGATRSFDHFEAGRRLARELCESHARYTGPRPETPVEPPPAAWALPHHTEPTAEELHNNQLIDHAAEQLQKRIERARDGPPPEVQERVMPDGSTATFRVRTCAQQAQLLVRHYVQEGNSPSRLDLKHYKLTLNQARAAARALVNPANVHITHLGVRGNNLMNSHLDILLKAVSACPQLVALDLSRNKITAKGAENLAGLFGIEGINKGSERIVEMDVSYNPLGDRGVLALMDTLKYDREIRTVRLDKVGGNDAAACAVGTMLEETEIEELSYAWNVIGDLGAKVMAGALAANGSLSRLNLSFCGLGDIRGAVIAEGAILNPQLISLDLGSNNLQAGTSLVLANRLAGNQKLVSLKVENNPLGLAGASKLMNAWVHSALAELSLVGCSFVDIHNTEAVLGFDERQPSKTYRIDLAHPLGRELAAELCTRWRNGEGQFLNERLNGKTIKVTEKLDWPARLPEAGNLVMDYKAEPRLPSNTVPISQRQFRLIWNPSVRAENESWRLQYIRVMCHNLSMLSAHAGKILKSFQWATEREEAVMLLFGRVTDPQNIHKTWQHLAKRDRAVLLDRLGILQVFNPVNLTGHYALNLSRQIDHSIAKRLLAEAAQELKPQGGDDPPLCDVKAYQWPFKNVRVERQHIDALELNPRTFQLPVLGMMSFDFVSYRPFEKIGTVGDPPNRRMGRDRLNYLLLLLSQLDVMDSIEVVEKLVAAGPEELASYTKKQGAFAESRAFLSFGGGTWHHVAPKEEPPAEERRAKEGSMGAIAEDEEEGRGEGAADGASAGGGGGGGEEVRTPGGTRDGPLADPAGGSFHNVVRVAEEDSAIQTLVDISHEVTAPEPRASEMDASTTPMWTEGLDGDGSSGWEGRDSSPEPGSRGSSPTKRGLMVVPPETRGSRKGVGSPAKASRRALRSPDKGARGDTPPNQSRARTPGTPGGAAASFTGGGAGPEGGGAGGGGTWGAQADAIEAAALAAVERADAIADASEDAKLAENKASERLVRALRMVSSEYVLNCEQVRIIMDSFPPEDEEPTGTAMRADVAVMFFRRLLDPEGFNHFCLTPAAISVAGQVKVCMRVGWGNVLNIWRPDLHYMLKLDRRDECQVARRLVNLSRRIRGYQNWRNLKVNGRPVNNIVEDQTMWGILTSSSSSPTNLIEFDFESSQDQRDVAAVILVQCAWRRKIAQRGVLERLAKKMRRMQEEGALRPKYRPGQLPRLSTKLRSEFDIVEDKKDQRILKTGGGEYRSIADVLSECSGNNVSEEGKKLFTEKISDELGEGANKEADVSEWAGG